MIKLFAMTLFLLLSSCASNEPAPIEYNSTPPVTKNSDFKVNIIKHQTSQNLDDDDESTHGLSQKEIREDNNLDGFTVKKANDEIKPNSLKDSIIVKKEIGDEIQEDQKSSDYDLDKEIANELSGESKNKDNDLDSTEGYKSHTIEDNIDGKFKIMPVQGKIIKKFSKGTEQFEAVIFASPKGGIVKSVSDGNVIFTGFDPKFGNIAIIGYKDFQIAYGYLQGLVAKKGNTISCGSVIGYVGDIINSKNSGLYFAIRKNNIPIDPESMLPNL